MSRPGKENGTIEFLILAHPSNSTECEADPLCLIANRKYKIRPWNKLFRMMSTNMHLHCLPSFTQSRADRTIEAPGIDMLRLYVRLDG